MNTQITTVRADGTVTNRPNYFLTPEEKVEIGTISIEEYLENGNIECDNSSVFSNMLSDIPWSWNIRFTIIEFEGQDLFKPDTILEFFWKNYLASMRLDVLLWFAITHRRLWEEIPELSLIGLRSSTEYVGGFGKRFAEFVRSLTEKRPDEGRRKFPIITNNPAGRRTLSLIKGGDPSPKRMCVLGAIPEKDFFKKLVLKKIPKQEYLALREGSDHKLKVRDLPLGTVFRSNEGYICEVVKGKDMLCDQYGARILDDIPERGLIYYRPVFID